MEVDDSEHWDVMLTRLRDRERREAKLVPAVRGDARHDAEVRRRRQARAELEAALAAPLISRGLLTEAERQAIRQSEFSTRRGDRDRVRLPK